MIIIEPLESIYKLTDSDNEILKMICSKGIDAWKQDESNKQYYFDTGIYSFSDFDKPVFFMKFAPGGYVTSYNKINSYFLCTSNKGIENFVLPLLRHQKLSLKSEGKDLDIQNPFSSKIKKGYGIMLFDKSYMPISNFETAHEKNKNTSDITIKCKQ